VSCPDAATAVGSGLSGGPGLPAALRAAGSPVPAPRHPSRHWGCGDEGAEVNGAPVPSAAVCLQGENNPAKL